MKVKITIIFLLSLIVLSCKSHKEISTIESLSGKYNKENSTCSLTLDSNGEYKINCPILPQSKPLVYGNCNTVSKGVWFAENNNTVKLISENYLKKQKGYEYVLRKEQKFSKDSIYIKVVIPDKDSDYFPMKFRYGFNNLRSNVFYYTQKKYIV